MDVVLNSECLTTIHGPKSGLVWISDTHCMLVFALVRLKHIESTSKALQLMYQIYQIWLEDEHVRYLDNFIRQTFKCLADKLTRCL